MKYAGFYYVIAAGYVVAGCAGTTDDIDVMMVAASGADVAAEPSDATLSHSQEQWQLALLLRLSVSGTGVVEKC